VSDADYDLELDGPVLLSITHFHTGLAAMKVAIRCIAMPSNKKDGIIGTKAGECD